MYKYKPEFIEKLNRCSMPNLAAEIRFQCSGHSTTYADHANITLDLLEAFLNGEEDITAVEFLTMARLNGNGVDYLSSKTLSLYDLSKRHDAKKVKVLFEHYRELLVSCDPECISVKAGLAHLETLNKMNGEILRADINVLKHHVYMAELNQQCKQAEMRKRGREKKITAPGSNPETVNGENDSTHISPIV